MALPEERYEIEGYYPIGSVAELKAKDPSTWEREWRLWHWTADRYEAKMTKRAGMYLCHRTCPISYTQLRIVRVTPNYRRVMK
jgi:hypothetical protein